MLTIATGLKLLTSKLTNALRQTLENRRIQRNQPQKHANKKLLK